MVPAQVTFPKNMQYRPGDLVSLYTRGMKIVHDSMTGLTQVEPTDTENLGIVVGLDEDMFPIGSYYLVLIDGPRIISHSAFDMGRV